MRYAAIVSIIALCALEATALADPTAVTDDDTRRDGCPAGYRHGYRTTDPSQLGATPDLDSALNPSQFHLSEYAAYFLSHSAPPDSYLIARNRLLTTIAHLRANIGSQDSQLTLAVTAPFVKRFKEDPINADSPATAVKSLTEFGNVVAEAGWRWTWATSIDRQPNGIEIAGIRNAFALQLSHGFPLQSTSGQGLVDLNDLASRALFDDILYRPDMYGATIEFRTEIVGCYEPFIHFMFQPRRYFESGGAMRDQPQYIIPVSATVGLNVGDRGLLMFGYGITHYTHPDVNRVSSFHRVRFAYEYQRGRFRAGANLDLFTGSYGGTFIGVYTAVNLNGILGWPIR